MSQKFGKNYKKISFKAGKFTETADELTNPYRGWYQIHTFRLSEYVSMDDREYTLNATDSLAFVLLDIEDYRDKDLDELALDNMDRIFSFFRDYRIDMIVRAVYDTEGNCMQTEPSTEEQIIQHMNQIVPILQKYAANIFVYQGLLIGNWGEMHSSKFLSPARLRRLSDNFIEKLDDSIYMAVRRPAYVRILFPEGEDLRQQKVGIFDDAILASPTHLGTFGEKPAKEVRREQSWLPKEEIEYVSSLCDRVPYGGEALQNEEKDAISSIRNSLKEMSVYFQKLHVTYLNRVHDVNFIEHLKNLTWTGAGIYRGMNGYNYITRHLGYRFVLRDVKMSVLKTDSSIIRWDITIENVGFARCFFKNKCKFYALDEFGNDVALDMTDWMSLSQIKAGEKHTFVCMTPIVSGNVYMSFMKEDTNQSVYFANKNELNDERRSDIYLGTVVLK